MKIYLFEGDDVKIFEEKKKTTRELFLVYIWHHFLVLMLGVAIGILLGFNILDRYHSHIIRTAIDKGVVIDGKVYYIHPEEGGKQ